QVELGELLSVVVVQPLPDPGQRGDHPLPVFVRAVGGEARYRRLVVLQLRARTGTGAVGGRVDGVRDGWSSPHGIYCTFIRNRTSSLKCRDSAIPTEPVEGRNRGSSGRPLGGVRTGSE